MTNCLQKYPCGCKNCKGVRLHNFMPENETKEQTQSSSVVLPLIYTLVRQVGIFTFGILIGMGIVLSNPPSDKELQKKFDVVVSEKNELIKQKADVVKNVADLQKVLDEQKKNAVNAEKNKTIETFVVRNAFDLK